MAGLNATKEPLNFLKIIGNSPQQQEADESDEETEEYAPINVVSKRKYTGNSQRWISELVSFYITV